MIIVFIAFFIGSLPTYSHAQGRRPTPIIREIDVAGRPCLSLEDVAKTMNGRLGVPGESNRVDLAFRSHAIQFRIDSDQAIVDGQPASLGGPVTRDGRGIWVPRSFFTSGPLTRAFQERIDLGPAEAADTADTETRRHGDTVKEPAAVSPRPPVPASPRQTERAEPAESEPAHAIRRIVIDPGHGGKDPGALGTRDTMEKSVNLWMANELADELRAHDFEVLLTRTDDSFIPLDERAALANKHKADLFISLHCNASPGSSLNGFEVYFLSEKASSPRAEAVARLENAVLELEGKKPSSAVQAVLQSLVKNANINRAAQLGAIINREVVGRFSQTDLGVKQAAFYVLRGAQMPAVLVELGFLSNRKEERLLNSNGYRRQLARAIAKSILEFDKKQQSARASVTPAGRKPALRTSGGPGRQPGGDPGSRTGTGFPADGRGE